MPDLFTANALDAQTHKKSGTENTSQSAERDLLHDVLEHTKREKKKTKDSLDDENEVEQEAKIALVKHWLTSRQIEATRRSITRYVRRTGKIWIRIFPDKPITERAAESRMGSGKGTVAYWVAVVKPGAVLFEINGLSKEMAYKVLKLASYKLPIKTKILEKA